MKSHIIYLTNDCNLTCDYCFEIGHHNSNNSIRKKDIDTIIKKTINTERNDISTICFFGGEPLLEMDKIIYTYNLCKKIKNKIKKDFAFNVITNGTLIKKNFEKILYLVKNDKTFLFDLTISFDGSFQYHRIKSDIVEQNLNLLLKEKVPFSISYTILDYNSDIHTVISEITLIFFKYILPQKNNQARIRINFDMKRIETKYGCSFSHYLQKLKKYLNYLFLRFQIPLCHVVCDLCRRCEHKQDEYNSLVYLPNQKKITVQSSKCNRNFDLF